MYRVTFSVDGKNILCGGTDNNITEWGVPEDVFLEDNITEWGAPEDVLLEDKPNGQISSVSSDRLQYHCLSDLAEGNLANGHCREVMDEGCKLLTFSDPPDSSLIFMRRLQTTTATQVFTLHSRM